MIKILFFEIERKVKYVIFVNAMYNEQLAESLTDLAQDMIDYFLSNDDKKYSLYDCQIVDDDSYVIERIN